jgi:hypothetical protein
MRKEKAEPTKEDIEFDKKLAKIEAVVMSIGTLVMPIIGGSIGIWLFWDIGETEVKTVVPTEVVKEYTVPANIFSTEHNVCGIITKNDIKLFAEMRTVPTCDEIIAETTEIKVTVVEDSQSINKWKVLRIAQNN